MYRICVYLRTRTLFLVASLELMEDPSKTVCLYHIRRGGEQGNQPPVRIVVLVSWDRTAVHESPKYHRVSRNYITEVKIAPY